MPHYCSLNKSIQKVYTIVRIIGSLINSCWKQLLEVTQFKFKLLLKVASVKSSDQVAKLFTQCDPENLQRWRLHYLSRQFVSCLMVLMVKRPCLMSSRKGNKKAFYRYLHSKRKARENVGLLKDTCKRLSYPKPLRLAGKSAARKIYPCWRRISLRNI